MALPADAFKTAWLRMLPNFVLPLGVLAGSRFFLPFYRDGRTITAFEFLEARFGPSTRLYGAFTFVVGQLLRISMILFLLGQLTHDGRDRGRGLDRRRRDRGPDAGRRGLQAVADACERDERVGRRQ